MQTPIATLVKRCKYKGGRKYRSAYRKLGTKQLSEIHEAGFRIQILPSNEEAA